MTHKILIADDYEDNREILRLILMSAEYDVREASDGRECLHLARELTPDLIMLDLSMPLLNGWQLFQELKADARTSHIPCVAVTASADPDRDRTLKAGFNGFLLKPFRREELLHMVNQLLTGRMVKADVANARSQQ